MKIALIGYGAIAHYVKVNLAARGHMVEALILRADRTSSDVDPDERIPAVVHKVADLPATIEHVIDCAGHAGLRDYGPDILRSGKDLTTVSIGALADQDLFTRLRQAATAGKNKLHLASGAIGALDCLRAAGVGQLDTVRYTGRKPPGGWLGSPAEAKLPLDLMDGKARTHFKGTARQAAIEYPKNANVAAAVALSGAGFDRTEVELIADPNITTNIHEIHASGQFGEFEFRLSGRALADNARSSALAAMSVISSIEQQTGTIVF
ncbi:MAG: aspartate dehydrogenase [Roseibium sp.]|uniref:aspartate dehydrogenase n=1 Tax=Roseibium sp. TaxID=1936156 RepID=UPI0026257E6E|nr:aspartate dehydrogenase [Roseibium sp.]MCV0426841.1 aspartate dehydrogenase [Roseibium sp.]